ncbi:SAM-dependent methyltransferase [Streptomyces sp. cg36]|uniref:SAM-dependent methyltransferase n=1 Tax=Streptomyces sp. cg36 TaxID=3238798 RepID=UPI0034E26FC7
MDVGGESFLRPDAARVYRWLSTGRGDFAIDDAFAQRLANVDDTVRTAAVINRLHHTLTAQFLAGRGFTQILDLGCGYADDWSRALQRRTTPLLSNVLPQATIVHVEIDAIAAGHAQSTMAGLHGNPGVLHADIRLMPELLAHPMIADRFDPSRPIAALLHDVLPWIGNDQEAANALTALRAWLPPGSALSLTHATNDLSPTPHTRDQLTALWDEEASCAFRPRTRDAIAALLGNWPLLAPGLVPTARWHPGHPHTRAPDAHSGAYAAIAVTP